MLSDTYKHVSWAPTLLTDAQRQARNWQQAGTGSHVVSHAARALRACSGSSGCYLVSPSGTFLPSSWFSTHVIRPRGCACASRLCMPLHVLHLVEHAIPIVLAAAWLTVCKLSTAFPPLRSAPDFWARNPLVWSARPSSSGHAELVVPCSLAGSQFVRQQVHRDQARWFQASCRYGAPSQSREVVFR